MELSDEKICEDEIQLYKNSMKNKSEIIKTAAVKLEKSNKHKITEIANRLVKLFPDWKKSTIYNALDGKYKREYEKELADDPHKMTLLEEIFVHLIDSSDNIKKFAKAVIKRANESPEMNKELQDALTESIHTLHSDDLINSLRNDLSKIRQLEDLVEFIKTIAFETQLLADKTDSRTKIDMGLKLGLKLKLTQHLPRELAKKLKISPKWLSQIDNDSTILNFIETIPCCPKCTFNFSEYINQCKAAEQKGLPNPVIN